MSEKTYHIQEDAPVSVGEPVAEYLVSPQTASNREGVFNNKWNPNMPFHGTQEEWWEHIREIEAGKFETWEEHQKRFNAWKKKLHESLM
jgi:hypothetical protein